MSPEAIITQSQYLDALIEIESLLEADPHSIEGIRRDELISLVLEYEERSPQNSWSPSRYAAASA